MNSSRMLSLAALLGAAAVLLGAFAAHGLKQRLSAEELAWFETGCRYQMYHALALFLCGLLARTGSPPRLAAVAFVLGTVLFSGSLYGLAFGVRWLAWMTPIGGVAFVIGWLALLPHCRTKATP